MNILKKNLDNQKGVVLASLMISTMLIFAIVLIITQTVVDNYKVVLGEQHRISAQFAADAGIDYAITQMNLDNDWDGVGETTLTTVSGKYETRFEVTVSDQTDIPTLPDGHKQLDVTGYTYFPDTASTPKETRSLTVELYSLNNSSLGASIVTGVGGLIMENSAKIVAGDVFVNGEIFMDNTSQIGTTTNPVNVRAAHQSCPNPPDATYPRVCAANENGEPITLETSAHIYANVQARNQTNGDDMTNPGLVAGNPTPEALPTHNRDALKAAAVNNMTGAAASCTSNNGTRNIPANTKITGNVTWNKNCEITINGDVWITGNLEMANSAQAIVAEAVGADMPDIMVDGSTGVTMRNTSALTSNSFETGIQLITYHSADTSCRPDCPNVTGAPLYDSRNLETITLDQSASGPESIFFAKWTQVNIINSGAIGALVGQTVRMRNSSTVTFGASISGVGVNPDVWLVYSYRQS